MLGTLSFSGTGNNTIVGLDVEWSDMFLKQSQDGPTEGSDFLMETRPEGKHYDYDVTSASIAAYVQSDWIINDRLTNNDFSINPITCQKYRYKGLINA